MNYQKKSSNRKQLRNIKIGLVDSVGGQDWPHKNQSIIHKRVIC